MSLPSCVLSLAGEHLSGMQQQQTAGPETEVDPLLSPGHSPAPKEVHCQKTQPLVFQRGK